MVILNWNGRRFLDGCLGSLSKQTFRSFELILVDNGSTDGSVEYVRSLFPWVRVIENGRNLGFAAGNNIGIRASHGDFVVVLNNDTVVTLDFVEKLVGIAVSDPSIGSVGCKILQSDGRVLYGPVFLSRGGIILGVRDIDLLPRVDSGEELLGCLANCGCAVLYRRAVLDHVGLYDEDFWSDWEDHDLGYRIAAAGYRNVYRALANVLHFGGGSFGWPYSRDRTIRMIANSLATYFKNFEARSILLWFFPLLLFIIPMRQTLIIILNEAVMIRREKSDRANRRYLRRSYGAWIQGYITFLKSLRSLAGKRARIQAGRKISDSELPKAESAGIPRLPLLPVV